MHPLCRLHPPKAKCTPLNGRCTPLSVFLSKRDNSSIKRSSHPQGWGDLFIKEGGIRTEGSWQHAGGIAALRRRGRMKQGRNFRSRAALRGEALRRDPQTANAARWIKSLLLRRLAALFPAVAYLSNSSAASLSSLRISRCCGQTDSHWPHSTQSEALLPALPHTTE